MPESYSAPDALQDFVMRLVSKIPMPENEDERRRRLRAEALDRMPGSAREAALAREQAALDEAWQIEPGIGADTNTGIEAAALAFHPATRRLFADVGPAARTAGETALESLSGGQAGAKTLAAGRQRGAISLGGGGKPAAFKAEQAAAAKSAQLGGTPKEAAVAARAADIEAKQAAEVVRRGDNLRKLPAEGVPVNPNQSGASAVKALAGEPGLKLKGSPAKFEPRAKTEPVIPMDYTPQQAPAAAVQPALPGIDRSLFPDVSDLLPQKPFGPPKPVINPGAASNYLDPDTIAFLEKSIGRVGAFPGRAADWAWANPGTAASVATGAAGAGAVAGSLNWANPDDRDPLSAAGLIDLVTGRTGGKAQPQPAAQAAPAVAQQPFDARDILEPEGSMAARGPQLTPPGALEQFDATPFTQVAGQAEKTAPQAPGRRDSAGVAQRALAALGGPAKRQEAIRNTEFKDDRNFMEKLGAVLQSTAAGYRGDFGAIDRLDPRREFEAKREKDLSKAGELTPEEQFQMQLALGQIGRDEGFNEFLQKQAVEQQNALARIYAGAQSRLATQREPAERLDPTTRLAFEAYERGMPITPEARLALESAGVRYDQSFVDWVRNRGARADSTQSTIDLLNAIAQLNGGQLNPGAAKKAQKVDTSNLPPLN